MGEDSLSTFKERFLPSPFILLDRDGTLIKHIHYLHDPKRVELLPGVITGLQYLFNLGFNFGVITNQSLIGRGIATNEEVNSVNAEVSRLLLHEGISLAFTFVCPHAPSDGCSCRKPAPALGLKAIHDFGIDLSKSFMLGDQPSDIAFGHAIACKAILLSDKLNSTSNADYNCKTLLDAAHWIETELSRS